MPAPRHAAAPKTNARAAAMTAGAGAWTKVK